MRIHGYAEHFRQLQGSDSIQALEDLLLCYYSGIDFIYIPNSKGGRNLRRFHNQLSTLHRLIEEASYASQEKKRSSRTLLASEGQEMLIKLTFEHYTKYADQPFDFIKRCFSLFPITNSLTDNYLRLLRKLQESTAGSKEWRANTYPDNIIPVLVRHRIVQMEDSGRTMSTNCST